MTGEDVPDDDAGIGWRASWSSNLSGSGGEINDRLTEAQDNAHHLPTVWLVVARNGLPLRRAGGGAEGSGATL